MLQDHSKEDFLPLSGVIGHLSDLDGRIIDPSAGVAMAIEELNIGVPIQLDIEVNETNELTLASAPPAHYVETSFPSVFHQLSLTLVVNKK